MCIANCVATYANVCRRKTKAVDIKIALNEGRGDPPVFVYLDQLSVILGLN